MSAAMLVPGCPGQGAVSASERQAQVDADRATIRRLRTTGRSRAITVSLVLALLGFALVCLSVSVGEYHIPLSDVVPAIFGHGDAASDFIVLHLRLPRALVAIFVGAAFGLSGAVFQSLARNPLASPDIIGINNGASVAAVFVIVVLHAGGFVVSAGALVGALATATTIYLLAYRRGISSYRLVLVGIGVAAVLSAITSYLLTRSDINDAERATVWLTGSLNGRGWQQVQVMGVALLVLVPLMLALTPMLRQLQLGDDTAKGLGVSTNKAQAALVLVAVALAAMGTSAAGPIDFVAFVAAPIARRLVRAPLTIVASALTGAVLLLASDLLARMVFAPIELPVGVVTGVLGAPYLVWLLARANRIGAGG